MVTKRKWKPAVGSPTVGSSIRTGSGGSVGFPLVRTHPQAIPTCTQHVDAAPADPPLRFCPVSQTPIYDQLRGERIIADVPATGAEPQQVDPPGKHRPRTGRSGPAAVSGRSLGVGTDLSEGWCRSPAVEPAVQASVNARWPVESARETRPRGRTYPDQPASSGQGAAALWGPQAALPPAAHARREQAQRGSDPGALSRDLREGGRVLLAEHYAEFAHAVRVENPATGER